jgi:transposase
MTKKTRRKHSADLKVTIIRKHLLDKVPLSDLCDDYDLHPTLFYKWLKIFFENGAAAFHTSASGPDPEKKQLQRKVDHLQAKIQKKDEVIAEVTQEYVALKKELGEP